MRTVSVRSVQDELRHLENENANQPDLTVARTYSIYYPSGYAFEVRGVLHVGPLSKDGNCFPVILDSDAYVLDDRAVLITVDENGKPWLAYHPTQSRAILSKESLVWMAENLDWPGRLFAKLGCAIDGRRGGFSATSSRGA